MVNVSKASIITILSGWYFTFLLKNLRGEATTHKPTLKITTWIAVLKKILRTILRRVRKKRGQSHVLLIHVDSVPSTYTVESQSFFSIELEVIRLC